ncbi:FxSxx-COOH system tetratricopeptide repeat protein [Streptomyces sp. NPDC060188]|uniref:FxSxx-COOH system tetratricopeptide repeat protein n=1 Tax=Streptomyces sp. NPDC060188 TaxID=3347068 RepID=UPI003648136F
MIPPRAGCFQSRAEVARLREALAEGGTAVIGSADHVLAHGVLAGMGGVGKTQLAADYARTVWQAGEVDVLVWITASNASTAASGYTQAGIEILGAEPELAAKAFLASLEPRFQQRPMRWLVVLDDVVDPAELNGLWPPDSPHGRTLITTRRKDAALIGGSRRMIEVGLFTEGESLAYLTNTLGTHNRTEPSDQLAALASDLGHLPLALSQATAYLIDAGMECIAYRALLADRATKLADATPDVLPDGQTHAMAAAWAMSIDRADTLRPVGLARPLLQLAAFLDANGIPETVLTSAPALAHFTDHAKAAGSDCSHISAGQARHALRALYRLSLIDHTPDAAHQAVRVHQLIQRAVRDALTPDQHDRTARSAADALAVTWPVIDYDTALAQTLRANTTALVTCAEDALYRPDAHVVLFRAGHSLGEAGQVTAARDYFHHLNDIIASRLGSSHPDALSARSYLAQWQVQTGDVAGAVAAFTELLPSQAQVLGPTHPLTLSTRHNLAYARGLAGDAIGAATASAELLEIQVQLLGSDHRTVLTTRHNLAHLQGVTGDASGAAGAFTEILKDRLRVLGPDHPDTLTSRSVLAHWRSEAGDATGAVTALAELLDDRIRVLGLDHPDTLTTRHNLAHSQGAAGNTIGAVTRLTELLNDRMRVLGPDHPDTLKTRSALAYWRSEGGDQIGALAELIVLLDDRIRVLGPDHPDTLTNRHNLAYMRGLTGDMAGAAIEFTELLDERLRILGPDHPNTFTTRYNLAHSRGMTGDTSGAVAALVELLDDQVRVLGPDHPGTRTTQANLDSWRSRAEAGDAMPGSDDSQ